MVNVLAAGGRFLCKTVGGGAVYYIWQPIFIFFREFCQFKVHKISNMLLCLSSYIV